MNTRPAASPPDPRFLALAGGVTLVLLVFLVYGPVLRGEFVWDDLFLVAKNPLANGELTFRSIWFSTDFPLTTVAFWAQGLVWGKSAPGFHVVNVALHAVNCILLWRVLARLQIRGAWFAAVLFAVHPVCVASVAWISELKNTLSLALFLLSFLWYLRFDSGAAVWSSAFRQSGVGSQAAPPEGGTPNHDAGRQWYWVSLLAFLLALLSKTSTVMLPVALLGCVWWRRGRISRRDLLATAPHFALALAFGLMSVWFQKHQVIEGIVMPTATWLEKLAGAAQVVWFYLGKALLPVNLCMIYPWRKMDSSLLAGVILLVALGVVFALGWWFRKSWGRPVLFGLGAFVVLLFPVLGFFDMYFFVFSRVSDHFAYLPLTALTALFAAVFSRALPEKIAHVLGVALVAALSLLTWQRARVFATDEGLWRDTLAKNPAAWNAHNNLGCILAEHQDLNGALDHFFKSVELNPRNASAHGNLGRALNLKGRFPEAELHFRTALAIKPDLVDALKAYGETLAQQGRREEAVKFLGEAMRLKPDNETRLQLAPLFSALGRPREAAAQCRAALAVDPNSAAALNNLAWLLATVPDETVRNGTEAVRRAEQACARTQFKDAIMVGTLGAAYAEAGRFTDATAAAGQAIELARATGNVEFARINQQLLRLYQSGKPYHQPSPPAQAH